MFKSSAKHLQWLGHDHNHTAHNNTLINSFNDNHAAFLAKLRIGVTLPAVVEGTSADILQISFRNGHFKGEAVLSKPMSVAVGESVLVELFEKTLGRDGKLYLKTKCLKKLSVGHVEVKCKNCSTIFKSIEELSKHLEYSCKGNVCRHCGTIIDKNNERHHSSKTCILNSSTPFGKKRKKKKKSGGAINPLKIKGDTKTI